MALPTSYMNSVKRLPDILKAIQAAQAPSSFTTRFLENLGFKAKGDRLIIGVLKDLGFLDEKGAATKRYYRYLDPTHSGAVLAEGMREAWSDLFALNTNAHQMPKAEFVGKLRTLSQGKLSDRALDFHYMTFSALAKNADFTSQPPGGVEEVDHDDADKKKPPRRRESKHDPRHVELGGLVYNIQIVLPESRDPSVYDALFKSLKDHLL